MKGNRKIIIGNIGRESFQGTPIELFEKAIELSKLDSFEVSTNNPQFLEALEVLCKEENLDVYLNVGLFEDIPITIDTAYDYLGDIYSIINYIRAIMITKGSVGENYLNNKIKEYKEKWKVMINEKEFFQCQEDLDYYKSKCASLETGLFNIERDYHHLEKEIKTFFNNIDLDKSELDLKDLVQLQKIMEEVNNDEA